MNPDSENPMPARFPDQRPPIEYLAAFLDGELSADDWARVQEWLANYPEDAALVGAHRNLLRYWEETAPAEPSEKAWREVLARIEGRELKIDEPVVRSVEPSRGRWIRVSLLGAVAAAAVILALVVYREPSEPVVNPQVVRGNPQDGGDLDELALLTADDVDVVSMEDNDSRLLVVGNPPLQEPLVLVVAGDVTLDSIEPDEDGFVPKARMNPGSSSAPMIFAPPGKR